MPNAAQQYRLPAVHMPLPPHVTNPRKNSHLAYPLLEEQMVVQSLKDTRARDERYALMHRVVNWLDVESSPRYRPDGNRTYCNIYAYDLCYYLGCYLPRVWWHPDCIPLLREGKEVAVVYGKTVFEQNCNALYNWFEMFGNDFCWKRFNDPAGMLAPVNEGNPGVIIARRRDLSLSGHITVALPSGLQPAAGSKALLQSQAGVKNLRYFSGTWWNNPEQFGQVAGWVYGL